MRFERRDLLLALISPCTQIHRRSGSTRDRDSSAFFRRHSGAKLASQGQVGLINQSFLNQWIEGFGAGCGAGSQILRRYGSCFGWSRARLGLRVVTGGRNYRRTISNFSELIHNFALSAAISGRDMSENGGTRLFQLSALVIGREDSRVAAGW